MVRLPGLHYSRLSIQAIATPLSRQLRWNTLALGPHLACMNEHTDNRVGWLLDGCQVPRRLQEPTGSCTT